MLNRASEKYILPLIPLFDWGEKCEGSRTPIAFAKETALDFDEVQLQVLVLKPVPLRPIVCAGRGPE